MLDGELLFTSTRILKDMRRYTSENSLYNTLNYIIVVLFMRFLIGDKLDKNKYNMLSNDRKKHN